MALKWGIASAGKISWDFVNGLATLPDEDHQVVAVAARDLTRAQEFAGKFGIVKAYDSYVQLAEDQDVEVVYIGTVNTQHFDVAQLMLKHGKHVLVEKPLCMNEKQAKKLIDYAEQKKLFLMEAIWSRFFPSYQYLQKQIQGGALGDIKSVKIDFGVPFNSVEILAKKNLGGGTILDLGVYNIQLSQWVFKQAPTSITAIGLLNNIDAYADVKAEINYGIDQVAHISTSTSKTLSNTATIRGTNGEITFGDFWAPTTLRDVDGTEKTWPLPATKYDLNYPNSAGLRYEAEEVRKCIRANELQSESMSHSDSLIIANIETEIRRQTGLTYPEDE